MNQYLKQSSINKNEITKNRAGVQRECLKYNIRGANNQLPKRLYGFVHLKLFNVKYKFVHLQLFDVKVLFIVKHIICKQKRTAVNRCLPLIQDFKLTRKNDDLLPSMQKQMFEVLLSVHVYTKIRITDKRYQTNAVLIF